MDAWGDEQRQAFGRRLQQARKEANLTQVDVAAMFDKHKAAVSAWEVGTNMPNAEQLARMAVEFKTSAEWLLYGVRAELFSLDLRQQLALMDEEALARLENGVRGNLGLDPLPKRPAAPGKPRRSA